MKTVALGRTGERVSELALGCMLMGTRTEEATAFTLLDRYREDGGSFLDTADCYAWWESRDSFGGESESLLGRWFARTGSRDDVFLATKGSARLASLDGVWGDGPGPIPDAATRIGYEGAGADTLRRALDASLRRLGTDHVDLYYVHVDDRATPLEETLEALAGLVAAGKTRYIGWSNVRTWRLERIRALCERHGWPAPVALQQQHSYLRRRAGLDQASIVDGEQLDHLRAHDDLTLVAYSPVLKGAYDDPARRSGTPTMEAYEGPDATARFAAVDEVARETGATPGQVVLAWLLRQDDPGLVPLVGPRTYEQYLSAAAAVELRLTAEQVARLDAAGA
ncbi:aldo/keto reductase [Streptomyces avicenniae]|uniref:aldo/keto reductase n=1 Tax=Streptomyces avicenniae TaxID=500153 RepID=UPI00069B331B|nr:aldo/keto reductase [Streptomyces avicenniae]